METRRVIDIIEPIYVIEGAGVRLRAEHSHFAS